MSLFFILVVLQNYRLRFQIMPVKTLIDISSKAASQLPQVTYESDIMTAPASKSGFFKLAEDAICVASVGLAACTAIGFLGGFYWFFDLWSHFKPHYIPCAAALTAAALFLKLKKTVLLNLAVLVTNAVIITTILVPHASRPSPKTPIVLTAVSANILSVNRHYRFADALLQRFDADIFLMLETTEDWVRETAYLKEQFPHSAADARSDNFGILFYSKYAFDGGVENFTPPHHPALTVPYIRAEFKDTPLNVHDRPLVFYGIHTTPPVAREYAACRDALMRYIAAEIAATPDKDIIVMGDLNDTVWSRNFQKFLGKSGLHSIGSGLQNTWPTAFPAPLRLQIDHALIKGFQGFSGNMKTEAAMGSDHLPVVLQIAP
ncbi:MAG: endonuclease/exonuclease/phosphatase family protein [Alphaproteobacteria bacterium]|nr:MAG: endonuclease/exonuclease/phosphatase family protein [Alphaproteobacteria bacterium]